MKLFLCKSCKYIALAIVAIFFLLSAVLGYYCNQFSNVLHQLLQQRITFSSLRISHNGMIPRFRLHNINIYNKTGSTVVARLDDLYFGVDVVKKLLQKQHSFMSSFKATNVSYKSLHLPFVSGVAAVKWHHGILSVNHFKLYNGDFTLDGKLKFTSFNDKLKLLSHFVIYHIASYYPLWLRHLIVHDAKIDGTISVDNNGQLLLTSKLDNVTVRYSPNWPVMDKVNGIMVLNNHSMMLHATAKTDSLPVNDIKISIPDIKSKILYASGSIVGDVKAMLHYVMQTPLRKKYSPYVQNVKLSGPARLQLKLALPILHSKGKIKVHGVLKQYKSKLELPFWHLALKDMTGTVIFNNGAMHGRGLKALLFNKLFSLNLTTLQQKQKAPLTALNISGVTTTRIVANYFTVPWLPLDNKEIKYNAYIYLHAPNSGKANNLYVTSDKLQLHAKFLDNKVIGATANYGSDFAAELHDDTWLLNINTHDVQGEITIAPHKVIQANFARFYINSKKQLLTLLKPDNIPAFAVKIDNVRYNGHSFSHVDLEVAPEKDDLYIKKLDVFGKIFQLSSSGKWGKNSSSLFGNLKTNNMGQLLREWGKTGSLQGGNGGLTFSLYWPGAFYQPHLKNISGNLLLNFSNGRIINLSKKTQQELGLGRVLNIFSLQTLPRRLTLNFSDLTQKGFSFDNLRGDFKLVNGNVYTNDTFINGVVARIAAKGRVGLVQHDYDLLLKMVPNMTSSLPVVATILGGPLAGAVTWAADTVFRHTLQPAAAYRYKIFGTWQHPKAYKL